MADSNIDSGQSTPKTPQPQARLNENLLSLGKLRNSTRSNVSSISVEYIKEGEETPTPSVCQDDENLPPPPSYESIVRIIVKEKEDSVSLPSNSQLPRYRDVAGLSDAPPTYHSLFSDKIFRAINLFTSADDSSSDEAADTCESIVRGRCKLATVCFNFLLFVFIVTFVLLLPVGMITIGIIFVHKCPVQPRIPIYLIVLGFFQMLECCGRLGYKIFQNGQERNSWRERYRRKDPLVYFVIVWFVIGSMWVYQTDPDCKDCTDFVIKYPTFNVTNNSISTPPPSMVTTSVTTQTKPKNLSVVYCDPIIYNFAFWIITTYYSVIGFFCLMLIIDVFLRTINRCCCAHRENDNR